MSNVFLHVTSRPTDSRWDNSPREFMRLPVVGEYVATESSGPVYRVVLVVHCPFEATYDAEVYAVKDDMTAALKAATTSAA
ncbi:MAG: hypothetical protein N838_22180 [Thiohalocapsa sp. PB-PSB1]|nr:MAG: hypothetical protein N838_22180 [Thiohalocapsa sp. PB-PSB1]